MFDPLQTTFGELIAATAKEHGKRAALRLGGQEWTYEEIGGAAASLAKSLRELGLGRGDAAAVMMPNIPQFVISFFAVQLCGARFVPLNCLHAAPELAYVIDDSEARVVIGFGDFQDRLGPAVEQCRGVKSVVIAGQRRIEGALSWDELVRKNAPARPEPPDVDPDEVAVLIYTSGTVGRAKGAMLTHRNIIFDADACRQVIDVEPDDVFLGVLPFFHSYGFTVDMVLPVLQGAKCVLLPGKFSARQCLQAMEEAGVTIFAGVPSMYVMMLRTRREPDYDLSKCRVGISGGAPVAVDVLKAFEARFGVTMLEGYGPTEAAPVVSVNPLHGTRKFGSVGPPLPGVKVKVVDDDDNELPVGEIGELCVQGPNVMKGYWKDEEMTAQALRGGWLHTGDMAKLDEDGYIYIVDRKKDMIIVGGMNVYPREVEEVIRELDEVADAAVVGVPDAVKGEEVVAYVQLKEGAELGEERVIEHCASRLARFKVPRAVVFVEELPRSPIGKVLRRKVREMAREQFGRQGEGSR